MKCQHCGTENISDAQFCRSCGSRILGPGYYMSKGLIHYTQLTNNRIRMVYGLIPAVGIIKKWDKLKLFRKVDYIEKISVTFLPQAHIFVKNDKWGVLDKSFNIVIPAIYDNLEWTTENKYLRAHKDGVVYCLSKDGKIIDNL